ncbi:MCE family protein [bacterium]|nr:MCE family protein [bacterium]
MQKTSNLIVVVGIFFIVGVFLLFYLSLRASGPSDQKGYVLYTEIIDAGGLEKDAEVTRAGVPVGFVKEVSLLNHENRVRIAMLIFGDQEIRQDAVAQVQLKSLLGTYTVHVSHGTQESPPAPESFTLASEEMVDINQVLKEVASIGDDVSGLLASVSKNQETFFSKINTVIDENRENVREVTKVLADTAPKVRSFFAALQEVEKALQEGRGTLGKLIHSDELHEHVRVAAANIEDITTQLREGQGTFGKFIYDEKMSEQVDRIFSNVDQGSQLVRDLLEGSQGDIQKMIKELSDAIPKVAEALNSFKAAGENFAEVSRKMNEGDGSVARLINDDQLYKDLRSMIQQIRQTFEEGEEQTVLRTFLGVFFGSVM